jgi:acetyl-CoA acetyltransferase
MLKIGDIAIVSGARTPFGRYCGKLKNYTAQDLGAVAAKGAIERAGVAPADFDHVVSKLRETHSMAHATSDCGPGFPSRLQL